MYKEVMDVNEVPMIKVQAIYDEVITHYAWKGYEDAKYRLLRNKYRFLVENVLKRDKKDYLYKKSDMLPLCDAPIVREFLIMSVDGDCGIVYDWFNGNVDTDNSEDAQKLYDRLDSIIMWAVNNGEIDAVTAEEWESALAASVNYTTAGNTSKIKAALESFRKNSLGLDFCINMGDIIHNDGLGNREFILKGKKMDLCIDGCTIDEALEKVASQDDYFAILAQVMEKFENHAKKSIRDKIITLAKCADCFDAKMKDAVLMESLASEYSVWYQKIYEYLVANPEICSSIEQETGIRNLADMFKMV